MKSKPLESEEAKAIENVLKILENMFFSMPIPEEILDKYNFLKESKYKRAGLEYAPIKKTQYPSIGASQRPVSSCSDMNKLIELEDCFNSMFEDQFAFTEAIINLFIDRTGCIVDIIRDPIKGAYCIFI